MIGAFGDANAVAVVYLHKYNIERPFLQHPWKSAFPHADG
jgi:hypothetical protein